MNGSSSGLLTPHSDGTSAYGTPLGATPCVTPSVEARGFAYKKEDVEETLYAGVSKKVSRKNSRNERRGSRVSVIQKSKNDKSLNLIFL